MVDVLEGAVVAEWRYRPGLFLDGLRKTTKCIRVVGVPPASSR